MRTLAAIVTACSLFDAGCSTLGSRDRDRDPERRTRQPEPRDKNQPFWLDGMEASLPRNKATEAGTRTDTNTVIAGRLIDSRDQELLKGRTFVSVRDANDPAPVSSKGGTGVETEDGYFFMEGLVPGKTYLVQASRIVDGRTIAAEAMIKPPASNIRLELSENKVSSATLPPPPGVDRGPFEGRGSGSANLLPPTPSDRGYEPGAMPPSAPLPPPPAPAGVRPENIANVGATMPPTAAIRPPPPPVPDTSKKFDSEGPSARLPGSKVPNFRISNLNGSDWEFQYSQARLILVDFWGTHCAPCMRTVPALKELHTNYESSGLEIVAIACEHEAPFATRVKNIEAKVRQKEMNYRVFLEREGKEGEVQRLFSVQYIPTLVLLDNKGNILWRGGGTDTDLTRLEEIVKAYLTKR